MNAVQIATWINVGSSLVGAGIATVAQLRGLMQLLHTDVSEAQLNQILTSIRDDAHRRAELARHDQQQAAADATGTP